MSANSKGTMFRRRANYLFAKGMIASYIYTYYINGNMTISRVNLIASFSVLR